MNNTAGKSDFKKLRVKRLPRAPVRETAEHRYWGNLKAPPTPHHELECNVCADCRPMGSQSPILVKHTGPVSHVHFNPTAPHTIAASASAGVQIYKPKSSTKQKTISRFKDVAYCPQFRRECLHFPGLFFRCHPRATVFCLLTSGRACCRGR